MDRDFFEKDFAEEMASGGDFARGIEAMDRCYGVVRDALADAGMDKSNLVKLGEGALGYGKEIAKLMYERHAEDDGNLVPTIAGLAEAHALMRALRALALVNPDEGVRILARHYTIPLNSLLYEQVQREKIEEGLAGEID
jgi:hypothetical protein